MVLVSVNGQFDHQVISVLDRGLLFGESVYEVIPVHHQKPFQVYAHLERLAKGFLEVCGTPAPIHSIHRWINEYVEKMQGEVFHSIYVQLTTGTMAIRHHIPDKTSVTCIIHQTFSPPVSIAEYQHGFRAITVADTRSQHARVKTIQLALNTHALKLADAKGYDDAVFIKDDCLVEAASSNVFAVINNQLVTPPLGNIVPGITRRLILEIAKQEQIPHVERPIHINELAHTQEIFLSSSIKLLKPLKEIEGLFRTKPHFPMWRRLFHAYMQRINEKSLCT